MKNSSDLGWMRPIGRRQKFFALILKCEPPADVRREEEIVTSAGDCHFAAREEVGGFLFGREGP